MKMLNNEKLKKFCLFLEKIILILLVIYFFSKYKTVFKQKYENLYNSHKIKSEIKSTIKSNYTGVDKVKYNSTSQCDGKCILFIGSCFKYEKIKNCKKYHFDVYMEDKFIINGYVMYKNNIQNSENLYYNLNHYTNVKNKIDDNINYSKVLYDTTIYNTPNIKIYSNENLRKIISEKYIKSLIDIFNSDDLSMTIKYKDSILYSENDYILIKKKINYKDYSSDSVKIYYKENLKNRDIEKVKHFLN